MATRTLPPAVEIRLLGSPEVTVHGNPLEVDTRKAVAILAVLATDGRPYGREELAALLWPDADDASARGALRRTLSVLRGAVGPDVLRVDRQQVALVPSHFDVDVRRLETLGASGNPGGPRNRRRAGTRAVHGGVHAPRQPRVRRLARGEGCLRGADRRTGAGPARHGTRGERRPAGAIAAAGRRIDLDPLDESAHVRRMELLAAAGDRAGAVRQYRACVAVLERELGVEPLARDDGPL